MITAAQARALGADQDAIRRLLSGGPRAHATRRPPAATNDPLWGDVHVTDYDDADILEIWGVPVLAGARLVVDCCDSMPADSALAVADAMLFRHLTTPDALCRETDPRQRPLRHHDRGGGGGACRSRFVRASRRRS